MNDVSNSASIISRKVISRNEVKNLLHIKSDSAFNNFRKKELTFPRPVKIGLRRIGWFEDELTEWLLKSCTRCEF